MSVIIVRKQGAKKLDKERLKRSLSRFDGFGITYFYSNDVKFTRQEDMDEFIRIYESLESSDLNMIIHLLEFCTGDVCLPNIQPYFISKEIGILSSDGYINSFPKDIQETFYDGKSKSDDFIVGEFFKKFCYTNKSEMIKKIQLKEKPIAILPIVMWNKFLSEHKDYLNKMKMALMIPDGSIFIKDPENGFYDDKEKLWFSEEFINHDKTAKKSAVKTINLNPIDFAELDVLLSEWSLVYRENLSDLKPDQLTWLCFNHNYQMAEIIKKGQVGYEQTPITNNKSSNAFTEDELEMLDCGNHKCYDCNKWIKPNLVIPFPYLGTIHYLCPKCNEENPPGSGK